MHIEQVNHETKGFFRAVADDKEAAMMTYSWAGPDKFIIDHTEVDKAFSGQGIGMQLVTQAVAFARESNVKVIPLCPYAKAVFDKCPEFRDVLA